MDDSKIPLRNQSPYGWWIASYIERTAYFDDPDPAPSARFLAWENTVIVRAPDREAAYARVVALFDDDTGTRFDDDGRAGYWKFEGLTSLLPIYEPLEDGAELLWVERPNRTLARIRSLVREKHQLEAFDDSVVKYQD